MRHASSRNPAQAKRKCERFRMPATEGGTSRNAVAAISSATCNGFAASVSESDMTPTENRMDWKVLRGSSGSIPNILQIPRTVRSSTLLTLETVFPSRWPKILSGWPKRSRGQGLRFNPFHMDGVAERVLKIW